MYGLGRRQAPDERDQGHLMSMVLGAVVRPQKKTWRVWWKGNQGQTPQCVGYAWYALLRALPHLQREPDAATIYHAAQQVDEWPGEDYEGTSVRGGAKALKAAGKLTAYAWAFTVEDILNWLGTHGPVVLGTNWYQGMFEADKTGLIVPTGSLAGGHAYLVLGYDEATKRLLCQNSWGTGWGLRGRFSLHYEDAERLLHEDGEACTPVE